MSPCSVSFLFTLYWHHTKYLVFEGGGNACAGHRPLSVWRIDLQETGLFTIFYSVGMLFVCVCYARHLASRVNTSKHVCFLSRILLYTINCQYNSSIGLYRIAFVLWCRLSVVEKTRECHKIINSIAVLCVSDGWKTCMRVVTKICLRKSMASPIILCTLLLHYKKIFNKLQGLGEYKYMARSRCCTHHANNDGVHTVMGSTWETEHGHSSKIHDFIFSSWVRFSFFLSCAHII